MSLISVEELATDPDFAIAFEVDRPRGGFDSTGVWTVSGYDRIPFSGNIQPASPEALKILAEGERTGRMIEIWTANEIRMSDGEKSLSDIVIIDGKRHRVLFSEVWPRNGQCHVMAASYDEGTGP